MLIAVVVLGGIYGGFFTPTEAAAVGCLMTLFVGLFQKSLTSITTLRRVLRESATIAAMIFFIIIGALFFSRYLAVTRIPSDITAWLASLNVPSFVVLLSVLGVWFLLGLVMLPEGIFALTIPLVFPLITGLGYDPIWFGIITMKLSEIANVTPPVGINIFTIQGVAGEDVEITDVYRGVGPFVGVDVLVLALMILAPSIVLFLPDLLFG